MPNTAFSLHFNPPPPPFQTFRPLDTFFRLITFLVLVTSFFFLYSLTWYAIRFGVEGLPRSNLSIPRNRGKVCLHLTLPRPHK
ncbi:hypothetical protein Hanom_Chr08g00741141 [Helianthus anomalus]